MARVASGLSLSQAIGLLSMRMGKSPGLKLQASIVQDNVPIEIAPGLFVGSIHAAFNVDTLKAKKISHILNLAGAYATFPSDFTYLSVSIRDKDYANLLSCLPVCALFLQAGIDAGGVLVHCAGGRSRSPAVAISYLMIKDKLSFEFAVEHVRTLRPVVALNAGFEAQLRCLERAHGNVFDAHQLHLQSKLCALAQRHADGSLALVKRRQHRHSQKQHAAVPGTPPHPSMSIRALQLERQAAGCDDRGMLDGTLPSGFSLSLPLTAQRTQFVPALRSMGSMFGCRSCGEHLFCASAIMQHSAESNLSPLSADALCSPPPVMTRDKGKQDPWGFDDEPAGEAADDDYCAGSSSTSTSAGAPAAATLSPDPSAKAVQPPPPPPPQLANDTDAKVKKTPLLAKLRLRPQSPSVSSPTGSDKSTPRASASPAAAASGATGTSAVAAGAGSCSRVDKTAAVSSPGSRGRDAVGITEAARSGGVLKKALKKDKGKPQDARCEKDECVSKTSDCTSSGGSAHGPGATGADKFWRTLTAFAATKRMFKDGGKEKHKHAAVGDLVNASSDAKARAKISGVDEVAASNAASQHETLPLFDALFLHENAAAWERGLHMLERASDDTGAALKDVAALIADDAKALAMLECDEWFIEPQTWFLDAVIESQSGAIRCPNSACSAVVGQWRWDGLSCSCGGRVCPGIQMKKAALQPLGNVVTQLHRGANDCAPQDADALYRQHS